MSEQLPKTGETVEQAIRRIADQKFRRVGLVAGAAELDAIADRAAELEVELALRDAFVQANKESLRALTTGWVLCEQS